MIMSQIPPLHHTQIHYRDSRGQSLISDEHIQFTTIVTHTLVQKHPCINSEKLSKKKSTVWNLPTNKKKQPKYIHLASLSPKYPSRTQLAQQLDIHGNAARLF